MQNLAGRYNAVQFDVVLPPTTAMMSTTTKTSELMMVCEGAVQM
jgi:hypothetical protein